jgi:hypothetical protein
MHAHLSSLAAQAREGGDRIVTCRCTGHPA